MPDDINPEKSTPEESEVFKGRAEINVMNRASACLNPKGEPLPATFGLIILIGVVYAITCYPTFQHPASWAYRWGSYYAPEIFRWGEWWRLVTPNLMHWDLGHLLSNAFGLWIFGRIVEPLLGLRNMTILFVTSGLMASLTMLAMDLFGTGHVAHVVGASGIDYGVMAAAFTFYLLIRRRTHPVHFGRDLRGLAILLAVYIYLNLSDSHLAIFGHLGGFLGGAGFAMAYYWLLIQKARKTPHGWSIDTRL